MKDILHGLDSISEIGYKLFGRVSIFFMNIILIFLCTGSITIYFSLFGSTCRNLFVSLNNNENSDSIFLNENFFVLIVAGINLSTIYLKAIKELKIVSVFLFSAIVGFTFFMIVYVCIQGTSENPDIGTDNFNYWSFKFNLDTVSAFSVYVYSFGFQLTLF